MNLSKWRLDKHTTNGKKGTIMLEAMVGMIVFGLILAIYIPGILQMQSNINRHRQVMEELRIFSELVEIYYNASIPIESVENYYENYQENFSISHFTCQSDYCEVTFTNGNYYSVEKESSE